MYVVCPTSSKINISCVRWIIPLAIGYIEKSKNTPFTHLNIGVLILSCPYVSFLFLSLKITIIYFLKFLPASLSPSLPPRIVAWKDCWLEKSDYGKAEQSFQRESRVFVWSFWVPRFMCNSGKVLFLLLSIEFPN